MERISTAEAIVAKELERIQSKAADEYDYDAAGETGVMSHGLNLNYILYFWQEFENWIIDIIILSDRLLFWSFRR